MKTLAHHIEHVRGRPPHVRKQITFALALGVTALIALLWLVISLETGAFYIQGTSFADAGNAAATTASAPSNTSLLGSAISAFSGTTTPAQLQVVNPTPTASAPQENPSQTQTVIPF